MAPPRLLAPLVAAALIALSLERLGLLHWVPATSLFVLLALFVFGTAASKRRALREAEAASGSDTDPQPPSTE